MTEPSASRTAYEALGMAKEAKAEIAAHEDVCALRYKSIEAALTKIETSFDKQLGMVWKVIAWAGGTAFLIVMGLLGFLAKSQFSSMTALQEAVNKPPPPIVIQTAPGQTATAQTGVQLDNRQQPLPPPN